MTFTERDLPTEYAEAMKSADIRGIYPTEIDEVLTYRVARAFVSLYGWKKVIVARDMRVSSPALHQAFTTGLIDQGATAVDIGLVGTPAMYFASGSMKLPGVMITASHNPKDYNGLKLVEPCGIPLTDKRGLKAIERLVVQNNFTAPKHKGKIVQANIFPQYKEYLQRFTNITTPRKLRVVIDAGNGMATTLAPILSDGLPFNLKKLFFKLDGTFPNRDSNPTLASNQKPILKELKSKKYDFGVAFDGDVDRVAFFDENGRYINSAVIGALIADHLLKTNPGAAFIYTNFTSRSYEDAIKERGGKAIRARVGHAFIKHLMREKDAIFAAEHSAHFYFKSNFFTDSGIITLLRVAEIVGAGVGETKSFSELIKPFDRYYQTEEVLVTVPNKKTAIAAVRAHFTALPIKEDRFDGLRMIYEDVWFTVKPSVTEDALKFVVESATKKRAQAVQKEILHILQGIA